MNTIEDIGMNKSCYSLNRKHMLEMSVRNLNLVNLSVAIEKAESLAYLVIWSSSVVRKMRELSPETDLCHPRRRGLEVHSSHCKVMKEFRTVGWNWAAGLLKLGGICVMTNRGKSLPYLCSWINRI